MTSERQSGWWWLSFADGDRPKGEQFLGAAIVRGASLGDAIREAWRLRVKPGGEVRGLGILEGRLPAEELRNRLLSRSEALEVQAWADERWKPGRGKGRA